MFTKPTYKIFKAVVEAMIKEKEYSQADLSSFTGKTLGQMQYFFSKAKWCFSKLNEYRLRFMRNKANFRDRKSDYAVLDGSTTKKDKDSEFRGLLYNLYSNRDKQVVNGIKIFGASVLTQNGVKYIVDFILYIKSMWLSENQAWKLFAKRVSEKTSAYLFILDSGFKSPYISQFIFENLKRHFLVRILPTQHILIKTKKKTKLSKKPRKFPDRISRKITSLCSNKNAIQVQDGRIWIFEKVILNSWRNVFSKDVTVIVYHANGHLKPIVLVTSEEIENKKDAFKIVETYFKRWSIEQLFKEIKSWFNFEKFRVTSLQAIGKFLHLVIFIHSLISVFFKQIQKHKHLLELIAFVVKKSRNILDLTVISLKLFFQSIKSICSNSPPWLSKKQKTVLSLNFL